MDGTHDRFATIEATISINTYTEHSAVGVWGPARIAVAMADMCPYHAESGLDLLSGSELGTLDRTTLAGGNVNLVVVHLDRSEVGRGLDEVFYLATHGQHTVSTGKERVEQIVLGLAVDEACGLVDR